MKEMMLQVFNRFNHFMGFFFTEIAVNEIMCPVNYGCQDNGEDDLINILDDKY